MEEGLRQIVCSETGVGKEEIGYLRRVEEATFKGFGKLFDPATGLPVDIASTRTEDVVRFPENPHYSKTSPTNVALGFFYLLLGAERGYFTEKEAYERSLQMLGVLELLETCEGYHFNWYWLSGKSGRVPAVCLNRFVSSVDNGNLDVSLMAVAARFPGTELERRIERFLSKRNYFLFFSKNPDHSASGMMSLGYDEARKAYSSSDYSIFNVEGRMMVLIAILKDRVPNSAWKKQARLVRRYATLENETIPVVAPWGGSLFEALFADEIVGGDRIAPKAFLKNAVNMIRIHRDKGKRVSESGIWGFSNGEVPGENRYEMMGVSEIAYSRFPGKFLTPYSSLLALRYVPQVVIENLKRIEALNPDAFNENYGFTDSLDPRTGAINRNILSLDKGMELLSIANFLSGLENGKQVQDYFWSYVRAKGWEAKAAGLLRHEEEHDSFKALYGADLDPPAGNSTPLDLLRLCKNMVSFAEPGRAESAFQVIPGENGGDMIRITYDVSERYSFAGMSLRYGELDISRFRKVNLHARGNGRGFPETMKIEVKREGKYIQFEHISLEPQWKEYSVTLPRNGSKADEISFVFENAAAGKDKTGEILIHSLRFQ